MNMQERLQNPYKFQATHRFQSRCWYFPQLPASRKTISTQDQCSTPRTNVRFSLSGSLTPQLTRVVVDRQGFHLKVSIYQARNDNLLAGARRAAQILKSGTICTGAAADSVRRCWI